MAEINSGLVPETAVKALSRRPAFALVFADLLIISAVATTQDLAQVIVVAISVVVLTLYAIWVIEVRAKRSVTTESTAQTERLEAVRDRDTPIRCVLDCLVRAEDDVYVVYSSTEVKEFVNQLDQSVRPEEDPAFGGTQGKRVTTIPDARGAARIHKLLYLGGKREKVRSVTSWPDEFQSDWWDASMVLIGSGRSNRITTAALDDFESPYRFSDDFEAIVDLTSPGGRWPASKEDLRTKDYGILVKFKVQRPSGTSVYFVIAGVGPYGTLAGCVFLDEQIERIYRDFDTSPFAYILSVRRDNVGPFTPTVEAKSQLPVINR